MYVAQNEACIGASQSPWNLFTELSGLHRSQFKNRCFHAQTYSEMVFMKKEQNFLTVWQRGCIKIRDRCNS